MSPTFARKAPDAHVSCSGCATSYSRGGWAELPPVTRLDDDHVRRHLSRWPDGVGIEVRACRVCGRPMARKERSPTPS